MLSTFSIAYKMLLSNKLLFLWVTVIFICFLVTETLLPFTSTNGQVPMMVIMIVVLASSIISQIFTESNYLYISKIILESHDDECLKKIASTKVHTLFFCYFSRAVGSFLAIILIVTPLIVIREETHIGFYWDFFLILLLLLALYVYPLVAYEITQSRNLKKAFVATFLIFSPSVWKQSLNFAYAKFIISLLVILSGVYAVIIFSIENIQDADNTVLLISAMMAMTVFSIFVALFILPIAMMLAWVISWSSRDTILN